MNKPIMDFSAPQWRQCLLELTRVVIHDDCRRLVLNPDRMSAEDECCKIKREYGAAMIASKITKVGKGKSATYTLAYTVREFRTEALF
jgi:hypothetical protein